MSYLNDQSGNYSNKKTPQSKPIYGENQVKNDAGGYVYSITPMQRFKRFLILGSEGGSYYVSQAKLTERNIDNVLKCIKEDGILAIDEIVRVSEQGLAPKNDHAIFALALACTHGAPNVKIQAYRHISRVCRIGTHLFMFCEFITKLRGWSRGLREGVAAFYRSRDVDSIAYQIVKYQQRGNWRHHDVLNLAHPEPLDDGMNALFKYIVKKEQYGSQPNMIHAFEKLKENPTLTNATYSILKHNLPREAIPTQLLNEKVVWAALLEKMPMTALIRNLGKMSNIGLLSDNLQPEVKKACDKITNAEFLHKARVHPIQILLALKTYSRGKGFKGSLTWPIVPKIFDALNEAFYMAFKNVEPTNKNYLLGIDVSGSMGSTMSSGILTSAECASAMAMVTAKTESNYSCMGFAHEFKNLGITPNMSLPEVLTRTYEYNFGNTDCSLPMQYASDNNLPIDIFIIYTDNQTWWGDIHPVQALKKYRQKSGRNAKLIVAAFEASELSIADPKDSGTLDIVGFSADVPQVIRQFSLGEI